jgi:LuxR family maltose regulon positive regulatory protein
VWVERNALDEAQRHADAGIEQTQWWQNPNHIIYAHLIAARIWRARGDTQAAWAALARADAVETPRAVVPILPALQDQESVALWLDQGDVIAARAWAASQEQPGDERLNGSDRVAATRALTLARVYLAAGQPARARSQLDRIVDEAGEQRDLWLKAQVWRARALQNLEKQQAAVASLRAAVAFAAPEAYLRPFLDAGKPLAALLLNVDGAEHAYAMHILAALGASEPEQSGVASEQPRDRIGALVEPLTDREHEVLAMMAAGHTNPEIAETLVIATGTVKAHTASIYQKLNVHNRTEAAARARELGLL